MQDDDLDDPMECEFCKLGRLPFREQVRIIKISYLEQRAEPKRCGQMTETSKKFFGDSPLGPVLSAYAVARKGTPQEQRELVYSGSCERQARGRIRDAVASGFDYGYIKERMETIAYLTESSLLRSAK